MPDSRPTHRRRESHHDYSSRCIYHITLVVSGRVPVLGRIEGISRDGRLVPDAQVKDARLQYSPLGMDVADCIRAIPDHGRLLGWDLQILQQRVMDTHLHFVLYVRQPMEDGSLGDVVRGFKTGCNKALRRRIEQGAPLPSCLKEQRSLFEEGYDATVLVKKGQLRAMIDYVSRNPWRKWLRRYRPQWLCPQRGILIAGRSYDAIGNVHLLGLRRQQVHVRSRWDDATRRDYMNGCIVQARRGWALVSPFISPHEQAVEEVALREGHSVIALRDNGFTDYTHCADSMYEYCLRGQLLLLVPSEWPHVERKDRITRAECETLNALAQEIAEEE